MKYVLNIDVSGKTGMVTLSAEGLHIDLATNEKPMDHAAFLQPAIAHLMKKNGLLLNQLSAVAVSNGPGSYTGLRVGLAAAKGLAFALSVPLLTINTLELMANAFIISTNNLRHTAGRQVNKWEDLLMSNEQGLICAIIDARRMELFFGLYDMQGNTVIAPSNTIADKHFMEEQLLHAPVFFTGSGNDKMKDIITHPNACFVDDTGRELAFAKLSERLLQQNNTADLAGAEPFYCKEFYDTSSVR